MGLKKLGVYLIWGEEETHTELVCGEDILNAAPWKIEV
jgi:hypothetical protein